MHRTSDLNVVETRLLPSPAALLAELPKTEAQAEFVTAARGVIQRLIFTADLRFLLIVGPCSIHDLAAGREYARRLAALAAEVSDRVVIVMRVYFEKPCTTVGWKGLVMDPHLDGSHDIPTGLRLARTFLREVLDLGLPTATELLDPITPQYIADLICWSAIGARTTESQTHRQMASGLSMPLGFKNSTDGTLKAALNAIQAAAQPQTFLGINLDGASSVVVTLPRLLQKAGYRTIEVGKGHFGPYGSEGGDPRNIGFDVNIAGWAWGSPATFYGERSYGNGVGAANPLNPGKGWSRSAVPGLEKYHGTPTHLSEALTLEAKEQITDVVHAGQPFFLYLSHYAPHSADNHNFEPDPRFAKNYSKWELTPVGHTWMEANARSFATLVEGVDKSLGDVLDHLDRLGVAENTIVLFLGDNGSDAPWGGANEVASAAPLRGKKASNYEGGVRVPFIAAWAKPNTSNPNQRRLPIAAGTIQSQLAAIYDLFPTILALAGGEAPAAHVVDGQRLDALLAGRSDPGRNETFLLHYPHATGRTIYCSSYREGDWKVLYHYFPSIVSDGGHYQLFNLRDDLSEQHNLATREPERLRRMMQALITALESQGAQYPVGEDGKTPERPKLP
jgi:arylsulfatase A-like enzyme